MNFHLGKPLLAMILIAMSTAVVVVARKAPPRADLVVWVFADSHARSYRQQPERANSRSMIEQYAADTGKSVQVKLINGAALGVRLTSVFDRKPGQSFECPDLVEIEIGSIGRYFRPPLNEVGLLPLDQYLKDSGFGQRIVQTRLATWSKDGVVFGVPHDIHPCTITYRKDLFDEAGVDLASAKTWPELQGLCLEFQEYWEARGIPNRHAMQLSTTAADYLVIMLLQRHINLLDDRQRICLTDPKVASTMAFYAQLVAGPRAIGVNATPGDPMWAVDYAQGDFCAMVTADWKVGYLKNFAKDIGGKNAIIPLPRFDVGDAPTASWGGTMIGIPKQCPQPDEAWKLLMFLYSNREGIATRWEKSMILPPVMDLWDEPAFHVPDPYFGGQQVGQLFQSLARQLPPRYATNFTTLAMVQLAATMTRAVAMARDGASMVEIEAAATQWLADDARDLQRRIQFGKFEQ